MRKTIPQYTIFTCDCCGRDQDDLRHKERLAQYGDDLGGLTTFKVDWTRNWSDKPHQMEVCAECSERIHDAIEGVRRMASSENIHEQVAMCERSKS